MAGFDNTQGTCQTADNAVGWAAPNSNFDTYLMRTAAGTIQVQKFDGSAGTVNSSIGLFGDGTSTAPSIAFAASPTQGFWRRGSSSLGLAQSTLFLGNSSVFGWTAAADASGSGDTSLSRTAAGVVAVGNGTQADVSGTLNAAKVLSTTATGGVGYGTGAGGAVTQLTSRTTGVTLNTPTGAITMFSAAGSATAASFTVTNSSVAATDVVVLSVKSATNLYELFVTAVAAGSFQITFFTTGGVATDAPVINYAVIKGSAS